MTSLISLVPMTETEFAAYRQLAVAGYADDNVKAGRWPAAGALQRSRDDFDGLLPQGVATPDNFLFDIQDEAAGEAVGILWFALVNRHGLRSAYVYDIEIKPEHRRHGHAKAAFAALELHVRALGLSSIGLHVFGHNPGAQALYSQLGYGVTGVNMLKTLDPEAV